MRWEYYRLATVESCMDEALHELGQDGWELVSVMPETRLFHGFQCILKRPCTGPAPSPRSPSTATPRLLKRLSVS